MCVLHRNHSFGGTVPDGSQILCDLYYAWKPARTYHATWRSPEAMVAALRLRSLSDPSGDVTLSCVCGQSLVPRLHANDRIERRLEVFRRYEAGRPVVKRSRDSVPRSIRRKSTDALTIFEADATAAYVAVVKPPALREHTTPANVNTSTASPPENRPWAPRMTAVTAAHGSGVVGADGDVTSAVVTKQRRWRICGIQRVSDFIRVPAVAVAMLLESSANRLNTERAKRHRTAQNTCGCLCSRGVSKRPVRNDVRSAIRR